jgi:hypothetical protein
VLGGQVPDRAAHLTGLAGHVDHRVPMPIPDRTQPVLVVPVRDDEGHARDDGGGAASQTRHSDPTVARGAGDGPTEEPCPTKQKKLHLPILAGGGHPTLAFALSRLPIDVSRLGRVSRGE